MMDEKTTVPAKELTARLRAECGSYDEWRVEDPKDGSYCIAYAWPETMSPEREAREWLADHKARFPSSQYAGYVVACVRVVPKKDRLLAEAADELERLRAALVACERVVGLLTPSGICDDAHHAHKDRHGIGDPCPVVARFVEAQRLARAALGA